MTVIRRHSQTIFLFLLTGIFLGFALEVINTVEDMQNLVKILSGSLVPPPLPGSSGARKPPKYTLAFLKGFCASSSLDAAMDPVLGTAWEAGKPFLPRASKVFEIVGSEPQRDTSISLLIPHIASGLTDIPTVAAPPTTMNYGGSASNLRETRITSRYWCLLAAALAREGKREQAWTMGMGNILLAQHLEAEESTCSGVSLIIRLVAIALRKRGTVTLAELAPLIRPDRAMALKTFDLMEQFERQIRPLVEVHEFEGRFIPTIARVLEQAYVAGVARKSLGTSPSMILRRLSSPETVRKCLAPIYDPIHQGAGEPWVKARITLKRAEDAFHDICDRIAAPRKHWIRYGLNPLEYSIDSLISLTLPAYAKPFEHEYVAVQGMRGLGITYALWAFHGEHQRWPKTLTEAETWIGKAFPVDRFTDAPLELRFDASGTPILTSVGPDLASGTKDDLVFFAVLQNPRGTGAP